jgi:hypothetical protein
MFSRLKSSKSLSAIALSLIATTAISSCANVPGDTEPGATGSSTAAVVSSPNELVNWLNVVRYSGQSQFAIWGMDSYGVAGAFGSITLYRSTTATAITGNCYLDSSDIANSTIDAQIPAAQYDSLIATYHGGWKPHNLAIGASCSSMQGTLQSLTFTPETTAGCNAYVANSVDLSGQRCICGTLHGYLNRSTANLWTCQ